MTRMKFGEVFEEIVTREEFPLERAREVLDGHTVFCGVIIIPAPPFALVAR